MSTSAALLARKSFEFSFSGLKTAAADYVRGHGGRLEGVELADFCASLQEAIADILTRKAILAAAKRGTWYRVRLGRFAKQADAAKAKGVLAAADIPAWVLKVQ